MELEHNNDCMDLHHDANELKKAAAALGIFIVTS